MKEERAVVKAPASMDPSAVMKSDSACAMLRYLIDTIEKKPEHDFDHECRKSLGYGISFQSVVRPERCEMQAVVHALQK